jgi:translation elongation factor EF-4
VNWFTPIRYFSAMLLHAEKAREGKGKRQLQKQLKEAFIAFQMFRLSLKASIVTRIVAGE